MVPDEKKLTFRNKTDEGIWKNEPYPLPVITSAQAKVAELSTNENLTPPV